jgi:hypothetical protein
MEAEALVVVLLFSLIGLVVLMGILIVFLIQRIKSKDEGFDSAMEFVKLMISLYEEQKERETKT